MEKNLTNWIMQPYIHLPINAPINVKPYPPVWGGWGFDLTSNQSLGLSQLCSKNCLKCFWEFPKNSPIMLRLFPIMLDYANGS